MFKTLKTRIYQGYQAIPDIKKAVINEKFRGKPQINLENCNNCGKCKSACPTNAINPDMTIDLGKCIFCGDCERECPNNVIKFTNYHKIASPISTLNQVKKLFGRSLKLRQVSAGGCNGCEMELNACSNVNFDMGRFGIDIVASPRHADGLIITGPITKNMAAALEDAYQCTPDPKIIILAGACAISGGVFQDSDQLDRSFLEKHKIDLIIPGCPVHPLTVINGILEFLAQTP